jgi:hypothetical protein
VGSKGDNRFTDQTIMRLSPEDSVLKLRNNWLRKERSDGVSAAVGDWRTVRPVRKTPFVLALMLGSATLLTAAQPIRATWNTNGFDLASPPVFQTKGLQRAGTVIAQLELSPDGAVKQAKILSGDAEYRPIVMESVRTWRFKQVPGLPASLQIFVYFVEDNGAKPSSAPAPPPPPFGAAVGSISISGLPDEAREKLLKAVGLKVGDIVTEVSFMRARNEARNFSPSMFFRMSMDGYGKLQLQFVPR